MNDFAASLPSDLDAAIDIYMRVLRFNVTKDQRHHRARFCSR